MPLWYDLEDPDKYLYHYTTREAALGSILPKAELRASLFRYMNDPRESKEWEFTLEGGSPGSVEEYRALAHEATHIAKGTSKVISLTRDDPEGPGTGFGQFGRGYAHSALWAHYGGGHSGVCLVFEAEQLRRAIEAALRPKGRLYAERVTYSNAPSDEIGAFTLRFAEIERVGLEQAIEEHISRWNRALFFRKSREWESEREYRWVLRSSPPVPEFVPIADALRAVVVGDRFPPSELDTIAYLAAGFSDLRTATCGWDNGVPHLRHHDLPPGSVVINGRFKARGAKDLPAPPSAEVPPPEAGSR